MGEGLASSEGLVRTTGCRSPLRAQKGPEKGPAAVSDSEGRPVLSSGPRLLLLPSCCEPSWTPGGRLVQNTLKCNGCQASRELRGEMDYMPSLLQRWEWSAACFWFRGTTRRCGMPVTWSEAQCTLFWFRLRWFYYHFSRKKDAKKSRIKIQ